MNELCFPNPNDFQSEKEYLDSLVKWKQRIRPLDQDFSSEFYSAFFRRPVRFTQRIYSKLYARYLTEQDLVLKNTEEYKDSELIFNENPWPVFTYSQIPLPDQYDTYDDFVNESKQWFDKEKSNFDFQFHKTLQINNKFYLKRRRSSETDTEEIRLQTFKPKEFSSLLKLETMPIKEMPKFSKERLQPKLIENDFYQRIQNTKVTIKKWYLYEELMDDCSESNSRKRKQSQNSLPNEIIEELVSFGPSKPLYRTKPVIYDATRKDVRQLTLENLIILLNQDPFSISDEDMISVVNCAAKKNIPVGFFLKLNIRQFFRFSILIWRFSPSIPHPYHPHIDDFLTENSIIIESREIYEKLWQFSMRELIFSGIERICKNLPFSKKLLSLVSKDHKSLLSLMTNFINQYKETIIDMIVEFPIVPMTVIDILIGSLYSNDSPFFETISKSIFTDFYLLSNFIPTRKLGICIQQYPNIGHVMFMSKSFSFKNLNFENKIFSFLYSLQYPYVPSTLLFNLRWFQSLAAECLTKDSKNSLHFLKETVLFIIRLNCKNFEKPIVSLNFALSPFFANLVASIDKNKDPECIQLKIDIVAKILQIDASFDAYAMVFISFISHSDYRVAHAAYKALKAVTVRNIDRFEAFIAKNELVLIQILKMSNPIVYADLMKLLARFIEVNIPSQVNSDGFFGVPNYVPNSFKMMNNFLVAADLLPKTVISILKNVPKSSELCIRSSQCLFVLRSVLQKRTTVAKLLLQ